jgi:hypothetical protein
MSVKPRQGSGDQKDLFDQALQASPRHGEPAKAEPDLGRARSHKRSRRGSSNEP